MDEQDFAILATLSRAPRISYDGLGARVGLSANAVKARVHKMEQEGVLQGFAALPRPSLLSLREGMIQFSGVDDLDAREEEILRGLAEVPGVRFTDTSADHSVWVWVLYRDDADLERIERAAISLIGKPPAREVKSDPVPADRALAPADWKVLRALQSDARAPVKALVARAGLSYKPLKRRLDALVRSGDVHLAPIVSPADASGTLLFRIVAFLAEGTKLPAIPDAILTLEAPGVASVLAQRATLRDARALLREVAAMPGVERTHLQIATRRMSLGWLDDALARQASAAVEAPLAPVPLPKAR